MLELSRARDRLYIALALLVVASAVISYFSAPADVFSVTAWFLTTLLVVLGPITSWILLIFHAGDEVFVTGFVFSVISTIVPICLLWWNFKRPGVLALALATVVWLIACLSGYHPHPLYVVCTHFPE